MTTSGVISYSSHSPSMNNHIFAMSKSATDVECWCILPIVILSPFHGPLMHFLAENIKMPMPAVENTLRTILMTIQDIIYGIHCLVVRADCRKK